MRMNTHSPGIDEPGRAEPRHVRDSVNEKTHSFGLKFSPGGCQILTDQPDVR